MLLQASISTYPNITIVYSEHNDSMCLRSKSSSFCTEKFCSIQKSNI